MLSGIDNQTLISLLCQIYCLHSLVIHFQRDMRLFFRVGGSIFSNFSISIVNGDLVILFNFRPYLMTFPYKLWSIYSIIFIYPSSHSSKLHIPKLVFAKFIVTIIIKTDSIIWSSCLRHVC
jgi:hypothetical protein